MRPDRPVVLITGATQYTGLTCAKIFARRGYDIVITSRDPDKGENAAEIVRKLVPEADVLSVAMTPSSVQETQAAFDTVKRHFGRLDCFIANAAAACRFKNILNTTEEDYDFIMSSNTKAYFFGTQCAAKLMIENKLQGSIILIGSVHSRGALPNRIPYAISKGGIEVLARNAAYELGKYGIRVNCLVAGAIVNEKFMEQNEEEKEARRANWPIGRESYPEDIAKAALFLASDDSRTITGTSLVVDSGVTACLLNYQKNWESIG
ncbi:MAG: SDR family NAD(P)-dependent oxidoreductase [Christensenellales bacterium]|jgi:NAD(P)-dependent dehydrogenase (short-subunit alcohol dehydrogenase family)